MSYVKREIGFMRTSATFFCCFFFFLNSSVGAFTLNDWWQIAWYVKFPYLSFDSFSFCTHNIIFSIQFRSLFRNYFWMQTNFCISTFWIVQTWILLLFSSPFFLQTFHCLLLLCSGLISFDFYFLYFCNIL